MLIKAGISNRGFVLESDVLFSNDVSVLTGRNGSGKTRFLSAISESPARIYLDGQPLEAGDITNIKELTPIMGGSGLVVGANDVYRMLKGVQFDEAGDVAADSLPMMIFDRAGQIDVAPMIKVVARKSGKKPRDLTYDDLDLYRYMPAQHGVGGLDVSEIFNQYLHSVERNRIFRLQASDGDDVDFLNSEEFNVRFGPEPWVELNKIMAGVFEGKFSFQVPAQKERDFKLTYSILDADGKGFYVENLSSGEKVLLSLVLIIFTSQYIAEEYVRSPRLIMFDEPDAHLHPKMVEHMYSAFKLFCESFGCHIIFTTHSPTTVALAPEHGVYLVGDGAVIETSKDAAISELLDGVTSIAVSPENRRQVYVESLYDVESFQAIYDFMASKSIYGLNKGVSLSFVPAGGKVPESQLRDFIVRAAPGLDSSVIDEFVLGVNGVGSCTQVYGAVESLRRVGNKTVRGVVDWDGRNSSKDGVEVFSHGRAYAIENVILDPLCMVDLISTIASDKFPLSSFTGVDAGFDDWVNDEALLQKSIETFVSKVLGQQFQGDARIEYASGLVLKTDSRYLYNRLENGHDLERRIVDSFPALRSLSHREGALKKVISSLYMTKKYSARFLPVDFLHLFERLQVS